jgi:hypothetical protein
MARAARLTGVLLARKGQARPTGGFAHAKLDLPPPQPSLARRKEQRSGRSAAPAAALSAEAVRPGAAKPRSRSAAWDRVTVTVRLDRERHACLKLLAARRGRSAQDILIKALDAYLEACAAPRPSLRSPARRASG